MKGQKGIASVPHKHLHARISYLYRAATYLATAQTSQHGDQKTVTPPTNLTTVDELKPDKLSKLNGSLVEKDLEKADNTHLKTTDGAPWSNIGKPSPIDAIAQLGSTRLLSQLRSVSLKSQIRLSSEMKHSICKRCNTLLISGRTSTNRVENKSRGCKKAWADLLIITCDICGMAKRFPLRAKRQNRRTKRTKTNLKISQRGDIPIKKDGD